MELRDLLARRRIVRSFDGTPVNLDWLESVCADALRAPTAGNSAGVRMHTFGQPQLGDYFGVATDEQWRTTSRRLPGLLGAGAGVIVTSRVDDYLLRYAEADKASSGLTELDAWPIPYWHTDAAMATMALLLLLEEAQWRSTLWGNFRHEAQVLAWAGIEGEQLFATVFIGRGDGRDVASASLRRDVPSREARVSRVRA